jgi:hypothetical protein
VICSPVLPARAGGAAGTPRERTGPFHRERFTGRTEETAAHELTMNPDSFTGRTDR